MTKETQAPSGGVTAPTLLTMMFVGLKLSNIIDWSWWWVLSPLWISIGLVIILAGAIAWLEGVK